MSSRRRDPHRETNDYNSPLNVLFTTMTNFKLFFDINYFLSSESHNFSFNGLASQNKLSIYLIPEGLLAQPG